jgi:hypothetical protein
MMFYNVWQIYQNKKNIKIVIKIKYIQECLQIKREMMMKIKMNMKKKIKLNLSKKKTNWSKIKIILNKFVIKKILVILLNYLIKRSR